MVVTCCLTSSLHMGLQPWWMRVGLQSACLTCNYYLPQAPGRSCFPTGCKKILLGVCSWWAYEEMKVTAPVKVASLGCTMLNESSSPFIFYSSSTTVTWAVWNGLECCCVLLLDRR
ncbi:hypothetical protein V8G54_020658 [Vigna mungo]|uniref:Uncharacterized protein n=1 Tax=Vigna mungo TaxID=3915 RepID=A0AAQ3NEB1_VIGMU